MTVESLLERIDLDPSARARMRRWLREPRFAEDRPQLARWVQDAAQGDADARAQLEDAFHGPLPIGTGGRRGPCGPGPNRINVAVMRETAQGLAGAMRTEGVAMKVAVVYDTRRDSRRFARAVADQLCACGCEVLLVDVPRPTPLLSHVVRQRRCGAGVVISASHNPPGDNGIKVYGPEGGQVVGPRGEALMAAIADAMDAELAPLDGPGGSRTVLRAEDVDAAYLEFVRAQGVAGDLAPAGLRAVYTPLHGVGESSVAPVLRGAGVTVHVVDAQRPDGGRFATVESANPEQPEALTLAAKLGDEVGADVVIATDPDADRLGARVRDAAGVLRFVDGNRLAVIMLDHVLRHAGPSSAPDDGRWVLTTVATTPLVGALAREAGVEAVDDLLVGFKHHAGMMAEAPQRPLVFAAEEAHGYLRGNDVHDKDGAVAALLLVEAVAVAKRAGQTVFEQLRQVWGRLGYHRERTASLYAHGSAGREAIAELLESWRLAPPAALGGLEVAGVEDRARSRSTGSPTRDLPSNVLVLDLQAAEGRACRVVVRPSGTEPKAKVYVLARSTAPVAPSALPGVEAAVDALADRVLADARARAEAAMDGVRKG